MLIYACIAEYFTTADGTAYLTFLVDDLDADTTSLQAFLGRTPPSNTRSITRLFKLSLSINRSLIHSISLDQSLTYSITLSINRSLIQSLSRLLTHVFNLFLDQSLAYSISFSINHLLIQSLSRSLARSLSPSENTLLAGEDMAQSLRSLSEKKLLNSYRLVSKIESTMNKFLIGYQHVRTHIPSEHLADSFPGVLEGVELVMWWGVCVA